MYVLKIGLIIICVFHYISIIYLQSRQRFNIYLVLFGTVSAKKAPRIYIKCYLNASCLNRYNIPTETSFFVKDVPPN